MPVFKLKKVWEYCSYNVPFFILILLLIFILNLIPDFSYRMYGSKIAWAIRIMCSVLLLGYGMSITRNRINHGYRLPKIKLGDTIFLGIKSYVVFIVYLSIQAIILHFISRSFDIPVFDLKDLFLNWGDYLYLIYGDPANSLVFLLIGGCVFYVTSFFAEIGIARLADTKKILSAFNLVAIVRSISIFGWRNYTRDLTSIVVALVILTYVKSFTMPYPFDNFWEMFFGFLIFATQFLGIGSVYCNIKDKETGRIVVDDPS